MLDEAGDLGPTRRLGGTWHRRAAFVGGALALCLVAAALALASANGFKLWRLNYLLFVVSCGLVGALLASRRPSNPVGWLYLTGAISFGLMEVTGHYALHGLVTDPGSLPAARWAAWPQTWLAIPAVIPVLTLVPLYFPDGTLLSNRWRYFRNGLIAYCVVAAVISASMPGDQTIQVGAGSGVSNPLGIERLSFLAPLLDVLMPVLFLGTGLIANASLFIRFRKSSGEQRQQIKYFAFAAGLLIILLIAERLYDPAGFLGASLLAALPLTVALAVLRYRLYDIDLVVNRTLVYSGLTGLLVTVYVLAVGVLGRLMAGSTSLVVSAAGAGVVAVLFAPLRDRLQQEINRLMFGERGDPARVLARLGERLEATIEPEQVLPAVVRTIAETLKLRYASIEVPSQGGWRLAAQHPPDAEAPPMPPGGFIRLPLSYGGETEARLVIAPRTRGDDFSPRHRALLEDLKHPIGAAVHAVRLREQALKLSADLQASRERLVGAREEERRRLRRDLHDGLGPQLAALSMKTEAARDLIASKPDLAKLLLSEVIDRSQAAVAEVRRVVYALAPPALDALGLIGALRSSAAGHSWNGLRVHLEVPDESLSFPAAVDSAAYFIMLEAMNNAAAHSGAQNCWVRVWVDGDAEILNCEVSDDGSGITEGHKTGVGLLSMAERAAELGGWFSVDKRTPRGTRVLASLPLVTRPTFAPAGIDGWADSQDRQNGLVTGHDSGAAITATEAVK